MTCLRNCKIPADFQFVNWHPLLPEGVFLCNTVGMEKFNYSFTSAEDEVLTEMIAFFFDCGIPDGMDEKTFNSVADKILLTHSLRPPVA